MVSVRFPHFLIFNYWTWDTTYSLLDLTGAVESLHAKDKLQFIAICVSCAGFLLRPLCTSTLTTVVPAVDRSTNILTNCNGNNRFSQDVKMSQLHSADCCFAPSALTDHLKAQKESIRFPI